MKKLLILQVDDNTHSSVNQDIKTSVSTLSDLSAKNVQWFLINSLKASAAKYHLLLSRNEKNVGCSNSVQARINPLHN